MAGKKKNTNDEGLGKTARASALKKGGKKEGFLYSGDMKRVVSLGGGTYCYLMDPRDGKTHHLQVGSSKYYNVVSGLIESDHGGRIVAELEGLNFPFALPVDAE